VEKTGDLLYLRQRRKSHLLRALDISRIRGPVPQLHEQGKALILLLVRLGMIHALSSDHQNKLKKAMQQHQAVDGVYTHFPNLVLCFLALRGDRGWNARGAGISNE
jgi:hypothetical protein